MITLSLRKRFIQFGATPTPAPALKFYASVYIFTNESERDFRANAHTNKKEIGLTCGVDFGYDFNGSNDPSATTETTVTVTINYLEREKEGEREVIGSNMEYLFYTPAYPFLMDNYIILCT